MISGKESLLIYFGCFKTLLHPFTLYGIVLSAKAESNVEVSVIAVRILMNAESSNIALGNRSNDCIHQCKLTTICN
jgi:hypothetical protein